MTQAVGVIFQVFNGFTGMNETFKAQNIYDLAGNCWEWTQEAFKDNYRILRGGYYAASSWIQAASNRDSNYTYKNNSVHGSRSALYVKLNYN